jgi:hypothetical protein
MKKILFVLAGLFIITAIDAQTLKEIVNSYSSAAKLDKLSNITSIKITGKMVAMGMEMPMVMLMKKPNKIKVTYSFNGQDMISVFDGQKGYIISPMMGSTDPVELTGSQLKEVQNNNVFTNEVIDYFKNGQLELNGQEIVNDKPAFKLKANGGKSPVYLFIDKATYHLVKTSMTIDQMGNSMNVDTFLTEYVDIKGVVLAKKTTAMANGMEAGIITFDKIEVNVPMEESDFKLK